MSKVHFREFVNEHDYFCHGVRRILVDKQTEFQHMLILDGATTGLALVLDGKWQSCVMDEFIYHESLVQPACIYQGEPKNVLVLGGGEGATVREALRWNTVEHVVMVDIDGQVVDACKEHLSSIHQGAFDDPRTQLIIGDAVGFIEDCEPKWDVIISDLSDPIDEGPSFNLFTKEMFAKCRLSMTYDGVFVVQAGSTAPHDMGMHVKLVKTMQAVFPHVATYSAYVPSFASPWGFIMGSANRFEELDPDLVDRELDEYTTGGLRAFDGEGALGLLRQPKYIRDAVDAETQVFSLASPPKVF